MQTLKELLFFHEFSIGTSVDIDNNQNLKMKSHTINVIGIGMVSKNIIQILLQSNPYNDKDDFKAWLLVSIIGFLIILYNISKRLQMTKNIKILDTIFIILVFILQFVSEFIFEYEIFFQNYNSSQQLNLQLEAFWLGAGLMTWVLLVFMMTNFFLKIVSFFVIYIYITLSTSIIQQSANHSIQAIITILII